MVRQNTTNRLQSSVLPAFAWTTPVGVFAVAVPILTQHVVEFIATGSTTINVHRTRANSTMMANLMGADHLRGQLEAAAWSVRRFADHSKETFSQATVYCHGVFNLPGSRELLVLAGLNPLPVFRGWLTEEICSAARDILNVHLADAADFDAHVDYERSQTSSLPWVTERDRSAADALLSLDLRGGRPILTAQALVPHLPSAATFVASGSRTQRSIELAAMKAILESGWLESRDGAYDGVHPILTRSKQIGFVSWSPYEGLPAYPELRSTIQRRLPRALLEPRLVHPGRPEFENARQLDEAVLVFDGGSDVQNSFFDGLSDIQLGDADVRGRVDRIRGEVQAQGFDAIAWFQPYHSWSEETWGIYFDARKLDDFALSLLEDFRSKHVRAARSDAARLAFGLTYAHELFHARVEAAAAWMEINALQPRYLRYNTNVYDALRDSPDCLEEALANWSAREWYRSDLVQTAFAAHIGQHSGLDDVVDACLDLSPPGYRDWRVGDQLSGWRRLATQLSTGRPQLPTSAALLPLESTLRGPLPYDLRQSDIPLRFVGDGAIADRLRSHPAILNVPARREIEKALKYFKHNVDPSGGKGSHQKWTGPDQRAFILPARDPLSRRVFQTFLQHVGIDKYTYINEVRPHL